MDSRPLAADHVADLYDELIEVYEREWDRQSHRSLHLGYYDDDHQDDAVAAVNTMRVLADIADIDETDRVLNVGCGAGADSVFLASTHAAEVIGVNISKSQIGLARDHATEKGVADLTTFRYDDFHELATVDDASVDVYWGLEALTHSDDIPKALAQARRVLTPGGRLAISDLFTPPAAPPATDASDLRAIEDALGVRFGSIDRFRSALSEAGFEGIDVSDVTAHIQPATKRRHTFSRIAGYAGPVLKRIGFFSDAQVEAMKGSQLLHERVADGSLGYFIVTATLSDNS